MVQVLQRAAKFTDELKRSVFADFFFASFARRNLIIKFCVKLREFAAKLVNFHMSKPTRGVLVRNVSLSTKASQISRNSTRGLLRQNAGIYQRIVM